MFQVNPLLGRGFTWKIKPYFLRKIKVKKSKCRLLQFLFGTLRVNTPVTTAADDSLEYLLIFFKRTDLKSGINPLNIKSYFVQKMKV